jgi:hypothetical protein
MMIRIWLAESSLFYLFTCVYLFATFYIFYVMFFVLLHICLFIQIKQNGQATFSTLVRQSYNAWNFSGFWIFWDFFWEIFFFDFRR